VLIVLFASNNPDEHKQHLQLVFQYFKKYGVILNSSKCELGVTELTFLGHTLNSQGIKPLDDKVKAIQDFLEPGSKHKLREFLGLINFYQ